MAAISALLNPVPKPQSVLPSPSITVASLEPSPSLASLASPPLKKQKLAKDAAVFTKHKVQGEMRYPPFENFDEACRVELQAFSVYPLGRIKDYRRHIPYNSDKKTFMQKTGRDAFEVFQYTFKVPGHEKEYVVMWDYNIGLVRVTPFFKCLEYGKTVPSKMMNSNKGLKSICHSITGGALVAQGYWMPFEAAKAVAATFCYSIRYALVPIFGPDFPASCIDPRDESFANMVIDPRIVKQCTQQAAEFCNIATGEALTRRGLTSTSHLRSTHTTMSSAPKNLLARWQRASSDEVSESTGNDSETERNGRGNFLPSPASILMRASPPRSAPNDVILPPLTEAALHAHESTMRRKRSRESDGGVSPKTGDRDLWRIPYGLYRDLPKEENQQIALHDFRGRRSKPSDASEGYGRKRHASRATVERQCSPALPEAAVPSEDSEGNALGDKSTCPTQPVAPIFRLPPLYGHDNHIVTRAEARAAYALLILNAADCSLQPAAETRGRKRRASH